MTDQLTTVLDRFVAEQSDALPPVAAVHARAQQRHRRRVAALSTAVLLVVAGLGGTWWSVRSARDPKVLVVADGEVRLNDWVTLTWLPDDVTGVEDDGTNLRDTMETFGYWQGHYSLRRGIQRPIAIHVGLGDPYDADLEARIQEDARVVNGRVEPAAPGSSAWLIGRVGVATVQVSGADLTTLRRLLDAMVVGAPTIELPGHPVTIASGNAAGIPWDLRVTTPAPGVTWEGLGDGRTCLVLREYVASNGCLRPSAGVVRTMTLDSPWDDDPAIGPAWLLLGEQGTVRFEYVRPDGVAVSVDARSAAPAEGAFAVIDAGGVGAITNVRALSTDGTVLGEAPSG